MQCQSKVKYRSLGSPLISLNYLFLRGTILTFPKNISRNFSCILDPNTFPEKASPFYNGVWRCHIFATPPKQARHILPSGGPGGHCVDTGVQVKC